MLVRLTRKLAERVDGIDLSCRSVDEIFDLPLREAELLIAEGWATSVSERASVQTLPEIPVGAEAADLARRVR